MNISERKLIVECLILIKHYDDKMISETDFLIKRQELIKNLMNLGADIPTWFIGYETEENKKNKKGLFKRLKNLLFK